VPATQPFMPTAKLHAMHKRDMRTLILPIAGFETSLRVRECAGMQAHRHGRWRRARKRAPKVPRGLRPR
jgi:hypothetical protein